MLAVVPSATLHGLDGRLIRVEVDVAPGLPGFTIVGLADTALQEARERVRGAIRNAGFVFPPRRITVNLAPAELRKAGASLDLAMAMGILLGSEQVRADRAAVALIGELSLGGEVRPVPGILPMVAALARQRLRRVVVAAVGRRRGAPGRRASRSIGGRDAGRGGRRGPRPAVAADARGDAAASRSRGPSPGDETPTVAARGRWSRPAVPDLAEVRGQLEARRALEIALAGGHGLLLIGSARRRQDAAGADDPGLLPPLDDAAALAVSIVASAAGEGPIHELRRRPPFRAPHHTLSYAAMVGGGPRLSPGEVTRADHGVLFLDELAGVRPRRARGAAPAARGGPRVDRPGRSER